MNLVPIRQAMTAVVLASLIAVACAAAPQPLTPIRAQLVVAPGQTVVVNLSAGSLEITGVAGKQLSLAGAFDPGTATYALSTSAGDIQVNVQKRDQMFARSGAPAMLSLQMPQGVPLKVETFDAGVTITGYQGNVDVESVAGNIVAEGLSGTIALHSGRGNVTIGKSAGDITILGEYGILALDAVTGHIGSSTIMGTIQLAGEPGPGDQIHLETDHGPVEIAFGNATDLSIQINSTSGQVNCVVPGLAETNRTCTGNLGHGAGALTVRTVSGDVTLQLLTK